MQGGGDTVRARNWYTVPMTGRLRSGANTMPGGELRRARSVRSVVHSRLGVACMFVAIGVMLAPSASAWAVSDNAVATATYLRADRALLRQLSMHRLASRQAVTSLVQHSGAECANVASHAPRGEGLNAFIQESLDSVGIALEGPNIMATVRFAQDIARLHWRNGTLTTLVHQYAARDQAEAALQPPHLCADLWAWAADSYKVLPQSTRTFLSEASRAEGHSVAPEEEILTLLTPFVRGRNKTLLRLTRTLQARTEVSLINIGLAGTSQLEERLGLQRSIESSGV